MSAAAIHGLTAVFESPEALISAAQDALRAGYTRLDAYSPFPIDELTAAMGLRRSPVPLAGLLGGVAGACGAYLYLWYTTVIKYPWDIGGRPLHSWPSYVPITFEMGVLGAVLAIFGAVLVSCRLPRLHHPIFNSPGIEGATVDRFMLCVLAEDPLYHTDRTRAFLESLAPQRIDEVSL